MARVIIICEGETEQEFCKDVLKPHFEAKQIYIEFPTIKKSNGGIVNWSIFKQQVETHLREGKEVIVTTFIDFYGILEKHNFPGFKDYSFDNKTKRENIMNKMKAEISPDLEHRFIPYIQLHEFESFLFCSLDVLKNNFKPEEADFSALGDIISQYPNPEDINNSQVTAPSKRLEKYIKGYNKVVYGACIAYSIGLNSLRAKCPLFDNWLNELEAIK